MCRLKFGMNGLAASVKLGVLIALLAIGLPRIASAQLHGMGGQLGVTGTNCAGQCISGFARAGDWIFFQVAATYNDGFGQPPFNQGDRSVITNVTISGTSPCLTFTSSNLLTLNALNPLPPGNILGGTLPVLSFPDYTTYIPVHLTNAACGQVSLSVQVPAGCSGRINFTSLAQAYDTNNSSG